MAIRTVRTPNHTKSEAGKKIFPLDNPKIKGTENIPKKKLKKNAPEKALSLNTHFAPGCNLFFIFIFIKNSLKIFPQLLSQSLKTY